MTTNDMPVYHHRLANTLLHAGYITEAIEKGIDAIRQDHSGLAHAILGSAYMRAGDLENACDQLRQGQTLLAKESATARMRTFLQLYHHDAEGFLPMENELVNMHQPSHLHEWYLEELLRHGEFAKATKMIQNVVGVELSKYPAQDWRDFFLDLSKHIPYHQLLAIYAQTWPQGVALVEKLYNRGLEVLARWQTGPALQAFLYFFSRFRIRVSSNVADVMALLETAVADLPRLSSDGDYEKLRYIAEIDLHSFRLKLAMRTPMVALEDADRNAKYFETLAGAIQELQDGQTSPSSLTVAIWYQHNGRQEASRQILRPFIQAAIRDVKAGLEGLDNSSMAYDGDRNRSRWTAWYRLADGLNAARETVDAVAALSYIKQSRICTDEFCFRRPNWSGTYRESAVSWPMITWATPSPSGGQGLPKSEDINAVLHRHRTPHQALLDVVRERYPRVEGFCQGPYSGYMCNGCGKAIACCETSYRCTICIHADFCYNCCETLQANKMRINVCDASHSLLLLPAEYIACSPSTIRVGFENPNLETIDLSLWVGMVKSCEVDIEQWLASIEGRWHDQT